MRGGGIASAKTQFNGFVPFLFQPDVSALDKPSSTL